MSKPKIRFNGFTEDWEQRKVLELAEKTYGGGTPTTSNEAFWKGDIPWIQSSDITDGKLFGVVPRKFITQDGLNKSAAQLIPENSIAIITRVGVGKLAFMPFSYTTSQDFLSLSSLLVEPKFTVYALYKKLQSELNAVQGTSIKGITKKELLSKEIMLPTRAEQKAIGDLLYHIDHLITLHQRKCEQTKKLKKFMLQKMFPQNGKAVPEIRFEGFTEDWEQRKFKEVFAGLQNNTLSRAELNDENGKALNIHYGDILVKFGFYIDASKEQLPYITDEAIVDKYSVSYLHDGDIIIADTAEDKTVGKCTEIVGSEGLKLISGLHTIPCRPKKKFAQKYLGCYMNSFAYHTQLLPLMQGIKVTSISKTAIQNTNLIYPKDMDEQEKIGAYFSDIDHLITLHQRKCDELQNMKKFMLQNMFV